MCIYTILRHGLLRPITYYTVTLSMTWTTNPHCHNRTSQQKRGQLLYSIRMRLCNLIKYKLAVKMCGIWHPTVPRLYSYFKEPEIRAPGYLCYWSTTPLTVSPSTYITNMLYNGAHLSPLKGASTRLNGDFIGDKACKLNILAEIMFFGKWRSQMEAQS